MSTTATGQRNIEKTDEMGVASVTTKRRVEDNHDDADFVSANKLSKKTLYNFDSEEVHDIVISQENSSEFLTTSILAQTLLTTTTSSTDLLSPSLLLPVKQFKSSSSQSVTPQTKVEPEEFRSTLLRPKMTIQDATDIEFNSLLCHERTLTTVTVLSPIDDNSSALKSLHSVVKSPNMSICAMGEEVITEDENGKSYFNLGAADATFLPRKNSIYENNSTCNDYNDDESTSSCDSISSEDLFNSEEEFDMSDDEDMGSYKQQRSTVLHLSLCKLNMFRTQQCSEPNLHRSVLICNTLRHIEQEVKSEDEAVDDSLKSLEALPASTFWSKTTELPPNNPNGDNTALSPQQQQQQQVPPPPPPCIISEMLPSSCDIISSSDHDPYPPSQPNYNTAPFTSLPYDPNSYRATPLHSTLYNYDQNLASLESLEGNKGLGPNSSEISSSPISFECDSGYAEDFELSSYYCHSRNGSPLSHPASNKINNNSTSANLESVSLGSLTGSDSNSFQFRCDFPETIHGSFESPMAARSTISECSLPDTSFSIVGNGKCDVDIKNVSMPAIVAINNLIDPDKINSIERNVYVSILDPI